MVYRFAGERGQGTISEYGTAFIAGLGYAWAITPSSQSQHPGMNARVCRPLAAENGAAIIRIWCGD